MTVWIDADDLIRFFAHEIRPTGIQRFSLETYRALAAAGGEDVKFCRRGLGAGYRPIHFAALAAGIGQRERAQSEVPAALPANPVSPQKISRLRRIVHKLPLRWRFVLADVRRVALHLLAAWRGLRALRAQPPAAPVATQEGRIGGHQFDLDGVVAFQAGDWFLSLGAGWDRKLHPDFLPALRAAGGQFGILAYDMIPDLFPEWCTADVVRGFRAWLGEHVAQADVAFAISECTAADLVACLGRRGVRLPAAPIVVPVGNDTALVPAGDAGVAAPYVLMVGTIEARKNHGAMLRVWRRLIRERGAARVPTFVIAGKAGWLTADFMQQLQNANWLDGKIRFVESPGEAALAGLYAGCLFTVFPSLYEGWGLPVSESLRFGKVVAASKRASIPEAGGGFCAYFDPDNVSEMAAVIAGLIDEPERRLAMEARIAREFRAASWADTAAAILAGVGVGVEVTAPAVRVA
jgi:glycosyltransferase involved in cell wall biosynthesis